MEMINTKPEEPDQEEEYNTVPGEISVGEPLKQGRRRKRIKVRKRIRVTKRVSSKKKASKTIETIAWVLIIAAFLLTLIILILQLDIKDRRVKESMGKGVSVIENRNVSGIQFTV